VATDPTKVAVISAWLVP
jgi:hypothetical protein